MKKAISLILATGISASLLAGCGSSATAPASSASSAGSTTAESSATGDTGLTGAQITADPTTFSIFLTANNMPFDASWPIWQEAAKRTNVSLEGVIPQSNSNEEEAFNLMLSSGELADIIGYSSTSELEQLGRDGGVIPLNDLIDQYAPHIKEMIESDPSFRNGCYSLDGNIYQIPKNQELVTAEFWWIRQDWLNKLNLKTPTTVDELHDVLYAFRNEDPNGNSQMDEIPLFDRAGDKMPDEYLYLWDTSTEFYVRDGKVEFEPLEENFKTGVKNIVQWYKEGLIDPEIFTRGAKARDTLLSNNVGGCTHDWVSTGNYNNSLQESIPGFDMESFAPPADQNGNVVERTTRYPTVGWAISSTCADPVTAIKYFDYMFTDEGSTLMNWGIEGETYTVNSDGTKSYTDAVMKSDSPLGYLRSLGVQYRIGMKQTADYEYAFMTEAGSQATKLYNDHLEWYRTEEPPYNDGALDLKYLPEDESEYLSIMSAIRPFVDEKFQAWLLGTSDFDADYDSFVAELKSRGIDKAIEINQRAYDTFIGK